MRGCKAHLSAHMPNLTINSCYKWGVISSSYPERKAPQNCNQYLLVKHICWSVKRALNLYVINIMCCSGNCLSIWVIGSWILFVYWWMKFFGNSKIEYDHSCIWFSLLHFFRIFLKKYNIELMANTNNLKLFVSHTFWSLFSTYAFMRHENIDVITQRSFALIIMFTH